MSIRKREVQLAVTLVTKLSSYTPTDKVSFTERIVAETKELSGKIIQEYGILVGG